MRCSRCTAENREGRKFCAECGAPLNARCASCGAENEPTEKFCGECGAALSAPVNPSVAKTPPVQAPEIAGERRHLTILFGYLVAHDNDAERAARAGLAILDAIAQLTEQPAHARLAVRIGIDSGRVVVG